MPESARHIYQNEGARPDQQKYTQNGKEKVLGLHRKEPLTRREYMTYQIIHQSGINPVTPDMIYSQFFPDKPLPSEKVLVTFSSVYVGRVRAKLGENSIITVPHEGYLSRRALIEAKYSKKQKLKSYPTVGYPLK